LEGSPSLPDHAERRRFFRRSLGNFSAAQDKRRYAYILTPKGIAEKAVITTRFLARKLEEYAALRAEIDALRGELGGDVTPDARTRQSES
jgi:hypothetical protein